LPVSREKCFDVHCTLAAEVSVLYLFDILSMRTGFGKSLPGLTSAAPSNDKICRREAVGSIFLFSHS